MTSLSLKDPSLLHEANLIDGAWVPVGASAIDVKNPATGELIGRVPRLTVQEVRRAIEAAHRAFPAWRDRLPKERALILRNHGLLTLGRSVAEAFILMHNLERACRVQVAIQSTGQPTSVVPAEVCDRTARQYESGDTNRLPGAPGPYAREWRALLQRLSPQTEASYRA